MMRGFMTLAFIAVTAMSALLYKMAELSTRLRTPLRVIQGGRVFASRPEVEEG